MSVFQFTNDSFSFCYLLFLLYFSLNILLKKHALKQFFCEQLQAARGICVFACHMLIMSLSLLSPHITLYNKRQEERDYNFYLIIDGALVLNMDSVQIDLEGTIL